MEIEHINPAGGDGLENLCLSCSNCNGSKAIATIAWDPESGENVPLFNPRQQRWESHFLWIDNWTIISGITATGRATVLRLKMNLPRMIKSRARWVISKSHPPAYD